ncbi:bifunctional serine/threonine-protein kinase/ABC transporter substrate-binding protein [Aphanothece sacrum]|uniref:non-specific serine/threonine protein kinase n=1 Tax=Aphanothece sacrum FPU1 TaxID=1920663 RepID=A0A401IC45_APHSA|nr:bifunctional serine/threonine-protein kinase/ABC transporter substrate-binding protein [Aphanothece sacrum]GBF78863.1 serine/threonine protein kinase [Aphanothece sacrum FPU1]GBF83095.1 serine/threonine protein kinase [Aphanothece sacrum FPU3]
MCLNSGDVLHKRYKIIAQIGRGGFGRTYKAQDLQKSSHPLCAVKEIVAPQSSDANILQEVKKRFNREGESLSRLGTHPQIPELFDYFAENNKFYLIQEYIEGHDLSEEIGTGRLPMNQSDILQLLEDILEVLAFVHQQNLIHRDIKPSNLRRRNSDKKIVLIDFGAVKELNSIAITSEGVINITQAIGTPGYMAPEQQRGNPQLNSDLYALGMICIQALTGLHPRTLPTDPNTGNIIWRYATSDRPMINISPELDHILNKMVGYLFSDRYYSAVEALQELRQLSASGISTLSSKKPAKSKPLFPTINLKCQVWWGVGATLVILGVWRVNQLIPTTCPLIIGDKISCGEESLIKTVTLPEKQEGVKAYANQRYQEAVTWLKKARQKIPTDPEILIYLNNAQLQAEKVPFYTIGVAIPLGNPSDGGDSGQEILRGVAQLQTEVNRNRSIKGYGLRVVLGDDYNETEQAKEIATKLSEQGEILGIIGHYTSENTRAALPIYDLNHLTVISPTSTAESLTEENSRFLRTIPQDSVSAEVLARYLSQVAKKDKVVVFYNPNSAYSRSLHERFLISFDEQNGQVVKQVDLAKPIFDAEAAIRQAQKRGATSLVLFPDAKSNPYAFSNALKVIRANKGRYLIVGGNSLDSTDILQERALSKGIIVTISWHYLGSNNQNFSNFANQLWGSEVSSRTAMAYDAARVLSVGLESQFSLSFKEKIESFFNPIIRRELLYLSLKKPDFQTQGATGEISFELSGNRHEKIVELVKVMPTKCSPYGYLFIPNKFTSAEAAGLKCQ